MNQQSMAKMFGFAAMLCAANACGQAPPLPNPLDVPQVQQCLARGWNSALLPATSESPGRPVLWKAPAQGWTHGAIIVMHGGGGDYFNWCDPSNATIATQVGFSERAVARGFAVFLLDSTDRVTDNQGRVCGKVWDDEVRARPNLDLPYVRDIIVSFIPSVRPAGGRPEVFLTGLSSGGYMSVRAGSALDNLVTAFAPASNGDPYGWHRICDPALSDRERVFGRGYDNDTGLQISIPGACRATAFTNEKPWDSANPRFKPTFRLFHHEHDGINDLSCSERALAQLRVHTYTEAPSFILRGSGPRTLANHYWQEAYNEPMLDFFASRIGANTAERAFGGELSGMWWVPTRSGEGLMLEFGDVGGRPHALVTWFTYANGSQRWLAGSAPIAQGQSSVTIEVVRTSGADFGALFDPDAVVRTQWGTLTLTARDCQRMDLDWSTTDGASGALALTRFGSGLSAVPCR